MWIPTGSYEKCIGHVSIIGRGDVTIDPVGINIHICGSTSKSESDNLPSS